MQAVLQGVRTSAATADQGQDLVDGEKHDVSRELLGEHGIVAPSANAGNQLVIGLLTELREVEPLA